MRAAVPVLGLCLALVASAHAAARFQPAAAGPEGQRAFDDLARHYAGKGKPPYAQALTDLGAADPARRERAGRYLAALLRQALADEASGRGPCRPTPFFGGAPVCDARELRKELAAAFGKSAAGPAALEAARFLLSEEKLAENQPAGLQALLRIRDPRVGEVLRQVLAAPHPNAAVLTQAIREVGARRLAPLAAELRPLCASPRKAVRDAVRAAAPALGLALGPCPAPRLLPASFEAQLRELAAMVVTPIPAGARLVRGTRTHPTASRGGKPVVEQLRGWLLRETADGYQLLDLFAGDRLLAKKDTKLAATSLAELARTIAADRAAGGDRARTLSSRGGLTAQFQPGFVSLPEALVAAWALVRGDRATAASLILPRIDATEDDRWLRWAVRDLLGHHYHQEMLLAFSHERDYTRALSLARHLATPRFDEYAYQSRAKELAAQLTRRRDDFVSFKLPTPDEWRKQRATLGRDAQIAFLAKRLRLLNCIQWGQPGGVSYADPQYATSQRARATPQGAVATPVVNPYLELQALKLKVGELPVLVPFLADEDFMPTFSYWRDFHPQRVLHRVSWVVAEIVDAVAQRKLADLAGYLAADPAGRKRHLETIVAWCRANASRSASELRRETIRTTREWHVLSGAVAEAAREKESKTALLALVLAREADFAKERESLAHLVYRFDLKQSLPAARRWRGDANDGVRFWAALILLRHGLRAKLEGLDLLAALLASDDGSYRYPQAVVPLLALKHPRATALATAILAKPRFEAVYGGGPILHRLFLAGRKEALALLLRKLESEEDGGSVSGLGKDGKPIERKLVVGDTVAALVSEWRRPGAKGGAFDKLAPDAERRTARAAIKRWLKGQFAAVESSRPHELRTPDPVDDGSGWRIDAP
jgi:hypothetical protein